MTDIIEAFGLTKSYGTRRGIVDVSFAVREGEVFGFLGPNGAGKTTTIRTLLGLLRPNGGRASIFGLDVWADAPQLHDRLSYVGSDPGYLGELTAGEQLDYVAGLRGLPKGAWRGVAERFELDPTVQIRKLSRGNRQKVGVVQAFMGDAPLLVLDEPSSGLDPLMQREFLALVSEVRAAGRTVFLSSHNLPEVERSCDRVGIIREGRLIDISTVQALLAGHWRSVNLVLGRAGTRDVRPAQRRGRVDDCPRRPPHGPRRREPVASPDRGARCPRRVDHHPGDRGRLPALLRRARVGPRRHGREGDAMNPTAFRLEMRRSRTLLVWLGIVTAAYAGFITVFYTNVVERRLRGAEVYPRVAAPSGSSRTSPIRRLQAATVQSCGR
jgi:ABC-2 type transport system ATP-binding protein